MSLLTPRFVYHPAMYKGAKLGIKAIVLLTISIILLIVSLALIIWCCIRSKRRARTRKKQEAKGLELSELFKQRGLEPPDEWMRKEKRDRFWRYRERRLREINEGRDRQWREAELDGFGRPVPGLELPKRARVNWRMWSRP